MRSPLSALFYVVVVHFLISNLDIFVGLRLEITDIEPSKAATVFSSLAVLSAFQQIEGQQKKEPYT